MWGVGCGVWGIGNRESGIGNREHCPPARDESVRFELDVGCVRGGLAIMFNLVGSVEIVRPVTHRKGWVERAGWD
ncbi:hypothetical protein LYNGBM3L_69880 [Moorena producens 3L]|uniref:Uncharacterized protein n=1 Tax=Moorena producens 3L TaxID=489825 RepID=F4Y2V6_9CYAN|nr:hypothetical protein LYNGBM3L_69880 [Moorena producens 3L]OLT66574.1 hypothetical protein BI334_17535 [Moorena producens 3L]